MNYSSFIFDLDNTLYPAHSSLWAQIDVNIKAYVSSFLSVSGEEAFRLQKLYYQEHGTSLKGLMVKHNLDPKPYLDAVHKVDLSDIKPCENLKRALASITKPKYIFTSGSRAHALNILTHLEIVDAFDGIFDIVASDYTPKPREAAYQAFLKAFPLDPLKSIFIEDLPRNLEVPKALGMATLLITPQKDIMREPFEKEGFDAPYIDFVSDNLAQFLLDNV